MEEITRDNILSLDIATHCGYYSTHEAGTWNFKVKPGHPIKGQHGMFYRTLKAFVEKYNIKMIVAEDVNVGTRFMGMMKLAEFRGNLFLLCDELNLPDPKFISVSAIKKWATGDGKADKNKMIEFCKKRWGIDPVDDNMADAVHIFKYYVRLYKL
jgi:Holliday junction resolvasome RuvABC endonuclease subunit